MSLARVRKIVIVIVAVVAAAASACGGDDFHYNGTPGLLVPLTFGGLLPTAGVTINRGTSHEFVCDSGSPLTIQNSAVFTGLMDGKHVDDIGAFQLGFDQYTDVSWNFGDTSTQGIFGGDLLRHFAFTIDYKGQRGMLSDPLSDDQLPLDNAVQPAVAVPFQLAGGGPALLPGNCGGASNCGTITMPATRILLKATFENQPPVYVVVDTGATAVLLDAGLFTLLGDPNRPRLDGIKVAGVNGLMDAFYTRVWRLRLDGVNDGDPSIAVDDLPAFVVPGTTLFDGISREIGQPVKALVGGTFLRNFLCTLDYQNRNLRFARYLDETHIPADEFAGPGFTLGLATTGKWAIADIYTASDAYAQGLRVGDVVETIGSMPITGQPESVVLAIERSYAVGTRMPVGVLRASVVTTYNVLIQDFLPHYPPPP